MNATKEILNLVNSKTDKEENFPVSSFLISKKLQSHIKNFYIFARNADDIADHPKFSVNKKYELLEELDILIRRKKKSQYFFVNNLLKTIKETGVNSNYPLNLLKAFKQDVEKKRYKDWQDLVDYCDKSASPVGRFVIDLHYLSNNNYDKNIESIYCGSDSLCNSLQILNHIQDCKKDFIDLNRVYIPEIYFSDFNFTTNQILKQKYRKNLLQAINKCLHQVENMLDKSKENIMLINNNNRLKMETYVIFNIAKKLMSLLAKNDPIKKNVKLSRIDLIFCFFKGIIGKL